MYINNIIKYNIIYVKKYVTIIILSEDVALLNYTVCQCLEF